MADRRRERKIVTVLFADLVGFTSRAETLDPEDVEAILGPYHERLRSELERHGGTVEKFIGDAVMAVFGAPVAHEDDPERAVRAALAIRDAIVEDGQLEVRVGVTTGEALVNVDAQPAAGEAMVSGDVVNTAARLQSAAPTNAILVGEQTFRATRQMIDFRDVAPVDAKGKSEPVVAHEAIQARSRVEVELKPSTELVGRQHERELLLGAFERSRREGSTQLVTIVGVPGIGKSRLVRELYDAVERDLEIIFWRHGRSLSYGGGALRAFADMVKAQAGILESDAAGEAEGKLSTAVEGLVSGDDASWLQARLRPLVGLEGEATDRTESFSAWRRFVEALAEQRPTVLVFEDLHWADDDLLDFMDYLVDWASGVPLLVVGTTRPELLERRPGWGGGKRNAVTVSLSPLNDDETARLLGKLLGRPVVEATTQSRLLSRAGGNPLYAEQFARMLAERGDDDFDLPGSVQGIIAARLDGLAAEEKALLQDAAVLGKVFWLGALESVAAVERLRAEQLLHALERKEFVRRERRGAVAAESEYAFTHVLVRDVAYSQIPRAQRAEKHELAARWLEVLAADRSEDRAELLVHHYLAALELKRAAGADGASLVDSAINALREATERALTLSAYAQAEQFASSALELLPDDDERAPTFRFSLSVAQFHNGTGEPERAAEAAAEALLAQGQVATAAHASIWAAVCWLNRGSRAESEAAAERAVALVRDAPTSPEKVHVLGERARLLMLRQEYDESIELGRAALDLAEELGMERMQSAVLITIGTSLNGRDGTGIAELEHAMEIAKRAKAPGEVQRAHNNLAEHMVAQGQMDEALRLYTAARAEAERNGLVVGVLWNDANDAMLRYVVGDWESAERLSERFFKAIEGTRGHYLEPGLWEVRGRMYASRGDHTGADDAFARAVERAREIEDPQVLGTVLGSWARYRLSVGAHDEAVAAVDELLSLRDRRGAALYWTWLIDLAWVLRDLGRADELPAPGANTVWGRVAKSVVDDDLAGAADTLGSHGMQTEAAYARLRLAEALADQGRGDEASAERDRALAFYRSVGATTYVRRAEALLPASA